MKIYYSFILNDKIYKYEIMLYEHKSGPFTNKMLFIFDWHMRVNIFDKWFIESVQDKLYFWCVITCVRVRCV